MKRDSSKFKTKIDPKLETDTMLQFVIKFNAENPILYKGKWLPKRTLERLLEEL